MVPFPERASDVEIEDRESAHAVLILLGGRCRPTRLAMEACQRTMRGQLMGCGAELTAMRECAEHVFCPEEFMAAARTTGKGQQQQQQQSMEKLRLCVERQDRAARQYMDPGLLGEGGEEETVFSRRMASSCEPSFQDYFGCSVRYGRPDALQCVDLNARLNVCIFTSLFEEVAPEVMTEWTACLQRSDVSSCLAETSIEQHALAPGNARLLLHGLNRMHSRFKE